MEHTADSTIQKQWMAAIILSAILVPLSTLATILRFHIRIRDTKFLGGEDWCVLVSLIFYYGYIVTALWSFQILGGRSPELLSIPEILLSYKLSFAGVFFVTLSQGFAKFSLLLLYYRIFAVERRYRFWILGLVVTNILWMIAGISVESFQCRPIRKAINPFLPGRCINVGVAFGIVELFNGLLDFSMVATAILMLKKIQISRRDKRKIAVIFAIGGFVGIISVIKIVINARQGIYNTISVGLWDIAQIGFAVICCCAPIYRSLLPKTSLFNFAKSRYASLVHGQRYYGSASRTAPNGDSTKQSSGNGSNWILLDEPGEVRVLVTTSDQMSGTQSGRSVKTVDVEQSIELA